MKNANNVINKNKSKKEKEYLRNFKFYPTFLYDRLDKWLKQMSLNGWHIVDCGAIWFLFEKGEPKEKEYFTHGLNTQEGNYSISLRYPLLEKTYGIKKKKSKINAKDRKSYNIVEIDTNRIDIKNNVGYKELISDRNRLYRRYFIRNLILFLVPTAIVILVNVLSK